VAGFDVMGVPVAEAYGGLGGRRTPPNASGSGRQSARFYRDDKLVETDEWSGEIRYAILGDGLGLWGCRRLTAANVLVRSRDQTGA